MVSGDLAQRLLDGEKIFWSGRPRQSLLFTSRDGLLIPFSLLWGGFVIFWEASVLRGHAPTFFALWGIPFVLAGLYFIAGRFAVDAWMRGATSYAVTNRRILIHRAGPFPKFVAISLDRLPNATLVEGANGRGTIRFGEQTPRRARNGVSGWTPSLDPTPQFLAIADARQVFDQVQRLMQAEDRP